MEKLIEILKKYKSAAIGFSGGCDSALLLHAAIKAGVRAEAITFHSRFYPESELKLAVDTAKLLGASHRVIEFEPLDMEELRFNPENRCYICKKYIFSRIADIAAEEGLEALMDGSNVDDMRDCRPGSVALRELGVKSPLLEAGLGKARIRELLKEAGLPQWDKPSFACYFSRFPYGAEITPELVEMVARCEQGIHDLGLISARVRYHCGIARIETGEKDFEKCVSDGSVREKVIKIVKDAGFTYITLDLEGYRTGSMNQTMPSLSK